METPEDLENTLLRPERYTTPFMSSFFKVFCAYALSDEDPERADTLALEASEE